MIATESAQGGVKSEHRAVGHAHHHAAHSSTSVFYRRTLLQALEDLHDHAARSHTEDIRRRMEALFEEKKQAPFNKDLFWQVLKASEKAGDVVLRPDGVAELTMAYKRKRGTARQP